MEVARLLPHPADPFRPPDLRWRRAVYLVENNRRLTRRDDSWTCQAVRFVRALRRGRQAEDRLARSMPSLSEAYRVYAAGGLRRWEVEARLLATEPTDVIGEKCGLSPAVVTAYEALYYSVRECL